MITEAHFSEHVDGGNKGDEEMLDKYGVNERNAEGQTDGDFSKMLEIAVVKMYFKKKEEHRVTYKSVESWKLSTLLYVETLCRRCHLKDRRVQLGSNK